MKFELIVDGICGLAGMTMGADPLVTAVSIMSYLANTPLPAFIIREEPGAPDVSSWIEARPTSRQGGL